MRLIKETLRYSASDLVNFLGCKHCTELDRQTALGIKHPPEWHNPTLAILQQKGLEHERAYVEHLKSQGLSVWEQEGKSVEATIKAIEQGYDIITQSRFETDGWVGIADVLRKVSGKSKLGDSVLCSGRYEVGQGNKSWNSAPTVSLFGTSWRNAGRYSWANVCCKTGRRVPN